KQEVRVNGPTERVNANKNRYSAWKQVAGQPKRPILSHDDLTSKRVARGLKHFRQWIDVVGTANDTVHSAYRAVNFDLVVDDSAGRNVVDLERCLFAIVAFLEFTRDKQLGLKIDEPLFVPSSLPSLSGDGRKRSV